MTTNPHEHEGRITELSDEECRTLLGTTTVGRIAFVDDDGQQLVPVNFAYIDGAVYFRTAADGFLAHLAHHDRAVAFGVDHHDDMFREGWNVTVKGTAQLVEDRATINKVLSHERLRPWAGGVRPVVMRVTVEAIDGRRVHGH